MDREELRRKAHTEQPTLEVGAPDKLAEVASFRTDGAVPSVETAWGQPAPSASELAFGETAATPTSAPQVTAAPDAKQQADTETIHSRPQRLADKPLPPHQKYDPKFTSIALGRMHERMAPSSVRLPDAVVKGVQKAWEKSAKDGNEYGGNIVRTYGGAYEMKHGGQHSDDDEWMPNEKDTGFGGDLLGFVHTHPYHQEGYEFGTFSDADVANLCDYDTRLSIVRSGRYTFMLVKTKEFDEKMHREVESEKDPGRLVEKRERFKADMMRCWNAASNAHEGSFPDKLEAGVLAVCEKYHLVYYAGEGAQLGLRSPRKKQ